MRSSIKSEFRRGEVIEIDDEDLDEDLIECHISG